jgi:hypothetical protein
MGVIFRNKLNEMCDFCHGPNMGVNWPKVAKKKFIFIQSQFVDCGVGSFNATKQFFFIKFHCVNCLSSFHQILSGLISSKKQKNKKKRNFFWHYMKKSDASNFK